MERVIREVNPDPPSSRGSSDAHRLRGELDNIVLMALRKEPERRYQSVKDVRQRDAITVAFSPLANSKIGELEARFDIILGFTPEA